MLRIPIQLSEFTREERAKAPSLQNGTAAACVECSIWSPLGVADLKGARRLIKGGYYQYLTSLTSVVLHLMVDEQQDKKTSPYKLIFNKIDPLR